MIYLDTYIHTPEIRNITETEEKQKGKKKLFKKKKSRLIQYRAVAKKALTVQPMTSTQGLVVQGAGEEAHKFTVQTLFELTFYCEEI